MTRPMTTLATGEDIQQHFEDALGLLRHVRRTLLRALDRLAEDEPGAAREVAQKQSELEAALKRAFEAEERYNEWQAKANGIRRAAEIDFDALREEIACRLNTLAACCQDGEA